LITKDTNCKLFSRSECY